MLKQAIAASLTPILSPAFAQKPDNSRPPVLQVLESRGQKGLKEFKTPGIIYRTSDGKIRTLVGFPNEQQITQVLGPR